MLLKEINSKLETIQLTEEDFKKIVSFYDILNFSTDDFCKVIDTIGFKKIAQQQKRYEWVEKATNELAAKERYNVVQKRLKELEGERKDLESIIKEFNRKIKG